MELGPPEDGGSVQTSVGEGRPSTMQDRLAEESRMAVKGDGETSTEGRTGG